MSVASEIAGLIQVGKARGYSDLSAVYYADNELHPDIKFRESDIKSIGSAVAKRLPNLDANTWAVLILLVMGARIIPGAEAPKGYAMPGWAWAVVGFLGIILISGGLRR